MNRALTFFHSSIGKKVVMALTGVVLFGYTVGHMAGNLLIFRGSEAINEYSAFLRTSPRLLWGTRILLLAAVSLHILCAVQLARKKNSARPIAYASRGAANPSYASRTMYWSGPFIAAFVLFHLAHLTFGWKVVPPAFIEGDVYANLVNGFRVVPVALFYIAACAALGLHLIHGAWSMFQTVGLNHPRYNRGLREFARVATAIVAGGFILVPVAVLLGIVKP